MPTFISPIKDGYRTSGFGKRTVGGVPDFHRGVDMSRLPNSNVEILACANGTVVRAETIGTYGKVVIIRHNIRGEVMETLYAHLSSFNVKVNQKVKQGEKIGIMGNTGGSKANKNFKMSPHLHMELHRGTWNSSRTNAIDPQQYITLYTKGEVLKMQEDIKKLQELIEAQAKAIKELQGKGATEGCTKKIQELETKLANKLDKPTSSKVPSNWAKVAWDWITKKKDKKGTALIDGTNPQGYVTREQLATVLHRMDQSDK